MPSSPITRSLPFAYSRVKKGGCLGLPSRELYFFMILKILENLAKMLEIPACGFVLFKKNRLKVKTMDSRQWIHGQGARTSLRAVRS